VSVTPTRGVASATGLGPATELLSGRAEASPPASQSHAAVDTAPGAPLPANLPPTANVTAAMAPQSDLAAGSRPGAAGLGAMAPTAEPETQPAVHEMLGSLAQLARKPLSVPTPRPAPQEEHAPAKAGASTAKKLPLKDAL
jgi:hypothetical protein